MNKLDAIKKNLDFLLIGDGNMIIIENPDKEYQIGSDFYIEKEGKIHRYEVIGYDKNGFPIGIRL